MAESPTAAFILSLLGGIFYVIGGLVLVGIGAFVGALGSLGNVGNLGGLGGLGGLSSLPGGLGNSTSISGGLGGAESSIAALGEFGVVLGIATIALAVMLYRSPARHQLYGGLILTFTALSIVGSLGGLVIGFILGLVGGVLAISWKPTAAPQAQATRICPSCGTVVQMNAKFCSNCGRSLP